MRPVKIVHIITKLELGGAQQNTLFTLGHLDRDLFRPYLITNNEGILVPEALALKGVRTFLLPELIREINPLMDLRALFKIKGILRKIKKGNSSPMIVHTHSSKAGIVGRWAARYAGADVIIHTIHGFGFHDYQPSPVRGFFIFLERLTAKITDTFIVVSRANMEKGVDLGIFPPQKAVLIRSGIELEEFIGVRVKTEEKKGELGVDPDLPLITMIGCLKPQKAPLDYVEVAHLLLQEREATFIMVGDGVLRGRVERRVQELGLGKRFKLLGWRRDIPEILAATDIFVLTSLWEGLPRVLPQAMTMGIPIVATRVDGTPEAVVHGVNGFLAEPRDIKGVTRRVVYLLDHPKEAKDLGERGREMVEEFNIWSMLREQEQLYRRLLREKGRGLE
ncbi:MAG: glycosyltransferase family 4 protein [Deltaproteobacteria bacterium]|nr:glycosyltransferase family 4 protein [Deltaproteobacteria bacterium]